MSRIVDEPYFTYSAYNALTSGIQVKCPKCHGAGVVTADEDNAYFRCLSCGHQETRDRTIYRYDVHNQCKNCGRYYRVDIEDEERQHFSVLHVACPYCGTTMPGEVHKTAEAFSYIGEIRDGREPYFGLELWFLTSFQGKPVWALNREHLAYLIGYLSADLREKPPGRAKMTQADHLPTFMKTAKNRERIVKLLKKMQEELAAYDRKVEGFLKKREFDQAGICRAEQEKLIHKYEKACEANRKKQEKDELKVTENDIAEVVAAWTKIPVKKLTETESERLMKLESILHKRVIGQDAAVSAVSKAIRRGRVGLQDPEKPIGSFLFLGPTGVGKTELSKALAEAMFGSENALIRVDMSEYMEGHSVSKMIGSPPGYVGFEEGGQLSEKIRKNPYSVVLFDEIEKAHPDVFNVLLQVLDDGHITDSKGRKVSFKNTVLIMTSNAGAQRIIAPKNLGFGVAETEKQNYDRMKEGVMEEVRRLFKPEFINRIDEIMVFHPLTRVDMEKIITLLFHELSARCEKQLSIHLSASRALKEHLVEKYADYKMGARPLKRAVQQVVEDALAEELLSGRIKAGDTVSAGYRKGKVVFDVK